VWDERIDDCRGPKINHVFFRVQGKDGERGEKWRTDRTGKRRDRASGRDSVTHSVDRCRIVYLISGIINQEGLPTLERNASIVVVVPRSRNEDECIGAD